MIPGRLSLPLSVPCPRCPANPGEPCRIRFPHTLHVGRRRRATATLRRRGVIEAWCPACGKSALLVDSLGQHLHLDGTSNHDCWAAIGRGEVD